MAKPQDTILYQDFVSTLDLHEPQIETAFFKRYGDQGLSYMMIRALGFEKPVAGDTYGHFEEDYVHEIIKQKAATASTQIGSTGAYGITVTLDPAYVGTDDEIYPRVGDVVYFPDGQTGFIDTITKSTDVELDIYSENGAAITALTGGEVMFIYSGEFPEGSSVPTPAVSTMTYFSNDAQIIKEAIGVTGSELVNESRIDVFNQAGEFQGYYRKSQADLDYRMMLKLDGSFWVGKRGLTTKVPTYQGNTGKSFKNKSSQGLIDFINTNGTPDAYTDGSWAFDTEMNVYEQVLAKEFVPSTTPIWFPMGIKLYQEVMAKMENRLANTNVNFARASVNDSLFKANEALGATFNFTYYTGIYTYMFQLLSNFSNPKTFGSGSYKFPDYGFIIPLDKKKDPKTGNDISSIGMRYRQFGAYNRKFVVDTIAGFGATMPGERPVHTNDRRDTYMFAHVGWEFYGGNRMLWIKPS